MQGALAHLVLEQEIDIFKRWDLKLNLLRTHISSAEENQKNEQRKKWVNHQEQCSPKNQQWSEMIH